MKFMRAEWQVFCDNVRRLRRARGLTQEQLAERAKISCASVSAIEVYNGTSALYMFALADALGVTVQELFKGRNP